MRIQKTLTASAMVVLVLSCADFSHAQGPASAAEGGDRCNWD